MNLKRNSITLSLLATLVMASPTVSALYDIEDNNTRANQTGVLYAANSTVTARGDLSQTDNTDSRTISISSVKTDRLLIFSPQRTQ